jgi:hypothetical protein
MMYACSVAYVIVYVVASICVLANALPVQMIADLTQTDKERGARILIVGPLTLYCLYCSWFRVFFAGRAKSWCLAGLSLCALILSQSRLLAVIVVLTGTASTMFPRRSLLSHWCFLGFACVSAGLLYGMVSQSWNPFELFGSDSSALVRSRGYDGVREILWQHPWLGGGIAASDDDMQAFTNDPTLAPADLGPMGVWFVFGFGGLVAYVISVHMQCFCTRHGHCGSERANRAIQHASCVIGLFGCLTPTWFGGSLTGLFIALSLRAGRPRVPECRSPLLWRVQVGGGAKASSA